MEEAVVGGGVRRRRKQSQGGGGVRAACTSGRAPAEGCGGEGEQRGERRRRGCRRRHGRCQGLLGLGYGLGLLRQVLLEFTPKPNFHNETSLSSAYL